MYKYRIHTTGIDTRYSAYGADLRAMSVGFHTNQAIEELLEDDKSYIKNIDGVLIMKSSIVLIEPHRDFNPQN